VIRATVGPWTPPDGAGGHPSARSSPNNGPDPSGAPRCTILATPGHAFHLVTLTGRHIQLRERRRGATVTRVSEEEREHG
jgi:hypothetical protein